MLQINQLFLIKISTRKSRNVGNKVMQLKGATKLCSVGKTEVDCVPSKHKLTFSLMMFLVVGGKL